jgi:hypothetical protein
MVSLFESVSCPRTRGAQKKSFDRVEKIGAGQSKTPVREINAEKPKGTAMDTNKSEVFVDPTEAKRAEVEAMTGVTVPESAAAVAVQSLSGGAYRLGVVPGGDLQGTAGIFTEETEDVAATDVEASEAAKDVSFTHFSKPVLRAGESSLIGPPGAAWGSRSIYMELTGDMTMTKEAFKYHIGDRQSFRSFCDSTFYVYWVDGSELPAHYLIILRQSAFFGVSDTTRMLHDQDHLRGFGMFSAKTEVRDVKSSTGHVELKHMSPAANARLAQVSESVSMTQDVPGGRGLGQATMQEGTEMSLDGWTAYNRTAQPDAKWEFAQNNTLDGGLNGTSLVNNHYNDQVVKPWPAVTTAGLNARTYAVWRVRGGKDATFSFGLELLQSFFLLTRGWLRTTDARGGILVGRATGLQPFSLNLREIANPK